MEGLIGINLYDIMDHQDKEKTYKTGTDNLDKYNSTDEMTCKQSILMTNIVISYYTVYRMI